MNLERYLSISDPVQQALNNGRPVVALESTIICHGMPWPDNAATARRVEATISEAGATPATIAIVGGKLSVGLTDGQIDELARKGQDVVKASRRDLPMIVASGEDGATTVASTMIIAAMAGIPIFATGGIGGVHRGVEETLDVSADLLELSRTDVAVVCAGIKSVLDIPRTLEFLETHGVPVIGYGTGELPAFYAISSGEQVDRRIDTPAEVAAMLDAKWRMGLGGGAVIANPVPEEHAMPAESINAVIEDALAEMAEKNIRGKDTTPFLLGRIAEKTAGDSLAANIALVLNNAKLAAQIAIEYQKLAVG